MSSVVILPISTTRAEISKMTCYNANVDRQWMRQRMRQRISCQRMSVHGKGEGWKVEGWRGRGVDGLA